MGVFMSIHQALSEQDQPGGFPLGFFLYPAPATVRYRAAPRY